MCVMWKTNKCTTITYVLSHLTIIKPITVTSANIFGILHKNTKNIF